jgi:hypothetical protein
MAGDRGWDRPDAVATGSAWITEDTEMMGAAAGTWMPKGSDQVSGKVINSLNEE